MFLSGGINVKTMMLNEFSENENFSDFQVILIDNIPAIQMTRNQMISLRNFVIQQGGGLIFLGGSKSFTLGGYSDTILEEILPVKMVPPPRPDRSSMVMVLVNDVSGSMNKEAEPGIRAIDLEREASTRVIEGLKSTDYLGILHFSNLISLACKNSRIR
jgi:Ca-activated chloride channel homolog